MREVELDLHLLQRDRLVDLESVRRIDRGSVDQDERPPAEIDAVHRAGRRQLGPLGAPAARRTDPGVLVEALTTRGRQGRDGQPQEAHQTHQPYPGRSSNEEWLMHVLSSSSLARHARLELASMAMRVPSTAVRIERAAARPL